MGRARGRAETKSRPGDVASREGTAYARERGRLCILGYCYKEKGIKINHMIIFIDTKQFIKKDRILMKGIENKEVRRNA